MRNGDYVPSRLMAQNDAANLICTAKTQSNPESTVGLLSMGGKVSSVSLLVSPTDDYGKLLTALHASCQNTNDMIFGDTLPFHHAIQVATLALKHRREKKGAQRIVIFVASPVMEEVKSMSQMGKVLKKNNIAVDVVSFGDHSSSSSDGNEMKLQAFVEAANSNENSHFLTVPIGVPLTDILVSSPIVHGGEGGGSGGVPGASGGGGGGEGFEFGGVDPSMDPELALALRVSMEEERARQEAANKAKEGTTITTSDAKSSTEAKEESEVDIESDLLARAMALSQQPTDVVTATTASSTTEVEVKAVQPPPAAPASANSAFLDPNFVNNLLTGLPGVDPNDPKIKEAMAKINQSSKKDDKKDNLKDEKK